MVITDQNMFTIRQETVRLHLERSDDFLVACSATIHKQIFVFYEDTTGIRPEIVGIRQ